MASRKGASIVSFCFTNQRLLHCRLVGCIFCLFVDCCIMMTCYDDIMAFFLAEEGMVVCYLRLFVLCIHTYVVYWRGGRASQIACCGC